MAVRIPHGAYLQVTMRRSRRTWIWSAVIALTMNLALFTMMPHLLHRSSSTPVYKQLSDQISVVRIKRPDSKMRQKTVKPPEPPEKKVQPQAKVPAVRPVTECPQQRQPRLPKRTQDSGSCKSYRFPRDEPHRSPLPGKMDSDG